MDFHKKFQMDFRKIFKMDFRKMFKMDFQHFWLGPKDPIGAAKGCNPPQELEKAASCWLSQISQDRSLACAGHRPAYMLVTYNNNNKT